MCRIRVFSYEVLRLTTGFVKPLDSRCPQKTVQKHESLQGSLNYPIWWGSNNANVW